MRRFESVVSWGILIALIGGGIYFYPTEIRTTALELYAKVVPCSVPITYKIGSVDPKFGISQQQLQSDLASAAGLWNAADDKKLFSYDQTNGTVVVNLVYDSRQEMTKRLKSLGVGLSNDRSSYDQLKSKYDSVYGQYTAQKKLFENNVSAFNIKKTSYEKDVAYWNARGGAPRAQYEQLQSQEVALRAQSSAMQQEQGALNSMVDDVNDLATALNRLIDILKLDVQKYNATGQSNGSSFEEGLYERSVGKETITIFEYENNALLIRVLAHELGHAIGLEHVEDSNAIMYYLNQGTAIALTKADTDALSAVCKKW